MPLRVDRRGRHSPCAALGADVDLAASAVGHGYGRRYRRGSRTSRWWRRCGRRLGGAGDDVPTHRRSAASTLLERLGRQAPAGRPARCRDRRRAADALALAGIGAGVGRAAAQLQRDHQRRRAGGVGRDVVELGRLLGVQEPGRAACRRRRRRPRWRASAATKPRRRSPGRVGTMVASAPARAGGDVEAVAEDREGRPRSRARQAAIADWPRSATMSAATQAMMKAMRARR